MALRLVFNHGITGIDLNLYNGKTGHLLRVENKPRPDGKFKVPLTLDEAKEITVGAVRRADETPPRNPLF
jgi:hypothetical protein